MRRNLLYTALFLFLLPGALTVNAQTTLALGDIAFTGYNSSPAAGSDSYSFVILRTGGIAAGTVIKFTSRGWWGNAPNTTCGTNGWGSTVEEEVTWTAAVAIPYGRQIAITGLTASYPYGSPGTVTGTALDLSAGGDQILAYQGVQTGVYTMLAGIQANYTAGVTDAGANNWDNTGVTSPTGTQSNRPACLVTGTHALILTSPPTPPRDEVDNGRIKGNTILSGNPATDRSRVNNIANWDVADGVAFSLPGVMAGLPVNFTSIKALEKNSRVTVEWGVGFEEQIQGYTIEKSDDGRLWMEMGVVSASGQKSYSWIDAQPSNGVNYYRVRANEMSGATKYTTVAIVNRSKGGSGIVVYPSIVKGTLFSLQMNNMAAGNYKLNIHTTTGQLVMSRVVNHAGGSSTQTINLPATIQKGVYKVSLVSNDAKAEISTIVVQ
jgi:hypothetical protein